MTFSRDSVSGAEDKTFAPSLGSKQILPLDMTELVVFEKKVDEIVGVGIHNGPMYMRDFLNALEISARYYSQAVFEFEMARKKSKQAYSIAKLEKADAYLGAKGIRSTDGARETYADMDPEYLAAAQIEAKWKAISEYLYQKIQIFERAHDDSRKIFEKTREPRGSMTGLPSGD